MLTSAVKRLIMINSIQNKGFYLRNTVYVCVVCIYVLCIYKYTHTHTYVYI